MLNVLNDKDLAGKKKINNSKREKVKIKFVEVFVFLLMLASRAHIREITLFVNI